MKNPENLFFLWFGLGVAALCAFVIHFVGSMSSGLIRLYGLFVFFLAAFPVTLIFRKLWRDMFEKVREALPGGRFGKMSWCLFPISYGMNLTWDIAEACQGRFCVDPHFGLSAEALPGQQDGNLSWFSLKPAGKKTVNSWSDCLADDGTVPDCYRSLLEDSSVRQVIVEAFRRGAERIDFCRGAVRLWLSSTNGMGSEDYVHAAQTVTALSRSLTRHVLENGAPSHALPEAPFADIDWLGLECESSGETALSRRP